MIKMPITYHDFDGNKITEDLYFHLSKAELIDLETDTDEAISVRLERAGKSNQAGQMMKVFKELITASYGQRVDGSGSKFYKDEDLTKEFMGSLAFDQLLTDLLTGDIDGADFVNGLMPGDLSELAAKLSKKQTPTEIISLPAEAAERDTGLKTPIYLEGENKGKILPWAFREPTNTELRAMTEPQMLDTMRRKLTDWTPSVEA